MMRTEDVLTNSSVLRWLCDKEEPLRKRYDWITRQSEFQPILDADDPAAFLRSELDYIEGQLFLLEKFRRKLLRMHAYSTV